MKDFIVDTISREDLEYYGYDSSNVSDETMKKIAEVLRFTFRECVLENLPQIADEYGIPKNEHPCFTVSRVYVSLNDEDGNTHETKIFKDLEDAVTQLRKWRNDELSLREESGCYYQIKHDTDDKFRVSWDDDREMLSIGIC